MKELYEALLKAQSEIVMPKLNSDNPFFGSRYIDLVGVITCMKDPFLKNGLAVHQSPASRDGQWVLVTSIFHTSGQCLQSEVPLFFAQSGGTVMQSLGSAITYARRYALAAICNIAADKDDDDETNRNEPVYVPQKDYKKAQDNPAPITPISEETINLLVSDMEISPNSKSYYDLVSEATKLRSRMSTDQRTRVKAAMVSAEHRLQLPIN